MLMFYDAFLNDITGLSTSPGHLSSIHFLLFIHCWICLVCPVACKKVLHEAILPLCMDPRRLAYSRDAKLPYHTEHF